MRRFRVKKIVLLAWGCALAFGLTFQSARAETLHGLCTRQCNRACDDSGGCEAAQLVGPCDCIWVCSDGGEGSSTCVE